MALTLSAVTCLDEMKCGYRPIAENDGRQALERAQAAVRINESSDYAQVVLSQVCFDAFADYDEAIAAAKRSLEINPIYTLGTHYLGLAKICSGDLEDGLALCLDAAATSPRTMVVNHWYLQSVALGELALGRYDAAVDAASRSDQVQTDVARTLLLWSSAAGLAGDMEAAHKAAERLLTLQPDFRIRDFGNWPFRERETAERLVEGLRLSGLPQ
ncbi:MAG: tetratricopeptide repeat protein [Alphaproteobacteria bacterium]|jgi:tetratricopeptide (TPR) repeat protein|nr:tetratricopeptide repeat protein [Alphaproteobacteria bacterium]